MDRERGLARMPLVHPLQERATSRSPSSHPAPTSPDKEAAFARYCKERFSRLAVVFAGSTLLCALVWWPVNAVVFRELPEYDTPFYIWRSAVGVTAAAFLLFRRLPPFRAHDEVLFVICFALVGATMGFTTGLLGGPRGSLYPLLYVLGFGTVLLPLRLSARALLTLALSAAIVAGCLLPFPALRSSPYLPMTLSYLVWVAGIGVYFGHTSFLLLRSNFFQAALLAENNLLLEARVAQRTRELRELLSRLETTREEERSRIAREVHDQIGQELTAQRLTLAIAEECVDGEPTTARKKLAEMRGLLDQMMGTVRALIADLRPWILHDLGLGEAARWLARRTEELSGLRCELSLSGDPAALDPARSTAAFRILQESLNNVTKHAQATTVAIDITTTASLLVLRVQDDGIGPREQPSQRGFGLLGMRERAHALGGELSLRGLAEGGTEVTCRLPLGELPGGAS
jgi:signal transduction histidine kinase